MSTQLDNLPDFYRGDTYAIELAYSDPNTGLATDITGYVFTVTIKANEADADVDAVLQKQFTATGPDALDGIVELRLESTETVFPVGTYYMDIQRAIAGSPPDILTIKKQQISVLQDITLTP